ncbi:response regulator [Mesobacillus sp. LC4]
MRFFIVDDSPAIRAMLANIIEDQDFGTVVGEAEDGSEVYTDILEAKGIDILLIDLLMPNRDGLETIKEISPTFTGKIIMISQVESKELIGEAYRLGIDYYITKPLNKLEVSNVIKKVCENLTLKKSLMDIQRSLNMIPGFKTNINTNKSTLSIVSAGKDILFELGIISESGNKDLLDLLSILYEHEQNGVKEIPPLKDLFERVMKKRLGQNASAADIRKEIKAGEQRVRRALQQALEHLASLGLTDYSNPKFEHYSSSFFDYTQVRMKMLEIEGKTESCAIPPRSNLKKFLQALYMEAKKSINP